MTIEYPTENVPTYQSLQYDGTNNSELLTALTIYGCEIDIYGDGSLLAFFNKGDYSLVLKKDGTLLKIGIGDWIVSKPYWGTPWIDILASYNIDVLTDAQYQDRFVA